MTLRLPESSLVVLVLAGAALASFSAWQLVASDSQELLVVAVYSSVASAVLAAGWLRFENAPDLPSEWLLRRSSILLVLGLTAVGVESGDEEASIIQAILAVVWFVALVAYLVLSVSLGRGEQKSQYLLSALLAVAFGLGTSVGVLLSGYEDEAEQLRVALGFLLVLPTFGLLAVSIGRLSGRFFAAS